MDIITIEVKSMAVIVHAGKLPKSHLRYTSPVIHVYTIGNTTRQLDAVRYHAVDEAIKRGGRAIDVRRVPCDCGIKKQKPPVPNLPAQAEFWDDDR